MYFFSLRIRPSTKSHPFIESDESSPDVLLKTTIIISGLLDHDEAVSQSLSSI